METRKPEDDDGGLSETFFKKWSEEFLRKEEEEVLGFVQCDISKLSRLEVLSQNTEMATRIVRMKLDELELNEMLRKAHDEQDRIIGENPQYQNVVQMNNSSLFAKERLRNINRKRRRKAGKMEKVLNYVGDLGKAMLPTLSPCNFSTGDGGETDVRDCSSLIRGVKRWNKKRKGKGKSSFQVNEATMEQKKIMATCKFFSKPIGRWTTGDAVCWMEEIGVSKICTRGFFLLFENRKSTKFMNLERTYSLFPVREMFGITKESDVLNYFSTLEKNVFLVATYLLRLDKKCSLRSFVIMKKLFSIPDFGGHLFTTQDIIDVTGIIRSFEVDHIQNILTIDPSEIIVDEESEIENDDTEIDIVEEDDVSGEGKLEEKVKNAVNRGFRVAPIKKKNKFKPGDFVFDKSFPIFLVILDIKMINLSYLGMLKKKLNLGEFLQNYQNTSPKKNYVSGLLFGNVLLFYSRIGLVFIFSLKRRDVKKLVLVNVCERYELREFRIKKKKLCQRIAVWNEMIDLKEKNSESFCEDLLSILNFRFTYVERCYEEEFEFKNPHNKFSKKSSVDANVFPKGSLRTESDYLTIPCFNRRSLSEYVIAYFKDMLKDGKRSYIPLEIKKIRCWDEEDVAKWLTLINYDSLLSKLFIQKKIKGIDLLEKVRWSDEVDQRLSVQQADLFQVHLLHLRKSVFQRNRELFDPKFCVVLKKLTKIKKFMLMSPDDKEHHCTSLSNEDSLIDTYFQKDAPLRKECLESKGEITVSIIITEIGGNLRSDPGERKTVIQKAKGVISTVATKASKLAIGMFSKFGEYHSSVKIGSWCISWNSSEVVVPKKIDSSRAITMFNLNPIDMEMGDPKTITEKSVRVGLKKLKEIVARCIIKWNTKIHYERMGFNCQDFCVDLLTQLNSPIRIQDTSGLAMYRYLNKIRREGKAERVLDPSKLFLKEFRHQLKPQLLSKIFGEEEMKRMKKCRWKKFWFATHSQIDNFSFLLMRKYSPKRKIAVSEKVLNTFSEFYVLKGFDRSMWLRWYRVRKDSSSVYLPSKLGCAFNDPEISGSLPATSWPDGNGLLF